MDVGTERSRPLLPKLSLQYYNASFSSDDRWLAAAENGERKQLLVYEVLTGRLIFSLEFPGIRYLAFSPDGRLLVTIGQDSLDVWQVSTGQKILSIPARGRLKNWAGSQFANCLAFAPDGQSVATGHGDGTILVWDMAPAWKAVTVPKGIVDQVVCWKELANPDPKTAVAAKNSIEGRLAQLARVLH